MDLGQEGTLISGVAHTLGTIGHTGKSELEEGYSCGKVKSDGA